MIRKIYAKKKNSNCFFLCFFFIFNPDSEQRSEHFLVNSYTLHPCPDHLNRSTSFLIYKIVGVRNVMNNHCIDGK